MIDALSSTLTTNPRSQQIAEQSKREGSTMQMDDFLQLLTAQISNQDPLEPMKDTEFISQMANIASLEQMQQFSKGFSSFADSHNNMVSQSYLGKYVEIDDGISLKSGLVSSVEKSEEGKLSISVDGKSYNPEQITKVSLNNPNAK